MPNPCLLGGKPGWILSGASADLDFVNNRGWALGSSGLSSVLSTSRASVGMAQWADGHWSSFAANQPRITDQGLLVEEARTNLFLNSQAPATQTVTVVNGSTYTVSVYGTSSIVLTGATTGTVTQGSSKTFVAVGTSLVLTVTGAGGAFQNANVELGAFPTSPILTTSGAVTRAADIITLQGAALTAALNAKAAYFQTNGVLIATGNPRLGQYSGAAFFKIGSNNVVSIQNAAANVANATLGSGTFTGNVVKSSFGFDGVSLTAIGNGGALATQASAIGGNTGSFTIGNRAAADAALNGYMLRAAFSATKGAFDGMTAP